ncbi:MAG TPA: hypothetical protein DCG54_01355 [Anaerolineae bacterium]|jgi:serine/threonine-protein kinase|nr:hypothetical protein [Anaerolineae bacterium]
MLLNENWDFETAVREISQKYYAGGITTGPLRNRQIESWGQLVGKTRATGEFNAAIELHGSLSAFGRAYRVSLPILQGFRKFFENLPDDQVKDTVFAGLELGNWKLLRRLGRGGNANVWAAKKTKKPSALAAIKILKRARGAGLRRFIAEITILQQLGNFPGILPLVDSISLENIEQDRYVWLVIPIATPLLETINEQTLSSSDIVCGVTQIAHTLKELHSLNITHRDIKPDNLYSWNNMWVISDFGIASFPQKETLTLAQKKLGPLHYLAPEMLEHADNADAKKADVYSLAKTLWVLLTGQNYPPPGEQRRDVPAFHIAEWCDVQHPDVVDDLIESSTRHNPDKRPTMNEFLNVLREI